MSEYTLDKLSVGEKAIVEELHAYGLEKRRMVDLGLVPGTAVKALHKSPSGDPTAYCIMGAVIALRNADAAKILLEKPQPRKK